MNIHTYKKLCKVCDEILLSNKSTITTHAISSLHVIREHPETLKKYHLKKKFSYLEICNKIIKKISKLPKILIFEKNNFFISKSILQNKTIDCLILSNFTNVKNIRNSKDLYFGNLKKDLKEKYQIKAITAFRNFTKISNRRAYKALDDKNNNLILSKKTNFLTEILLICKSIKEFLYFKFFKKKNTYLNFLDFLSIRSNLRIAIQTYKLIKSINPKIILFTFEGHAWERVLIKYIKNFDKNIILAAYQFSIISKNQHSIFRELKKDYNPDIILTSGKITKRLFEKKTNYQIMKLYILGSYKNKSVKDIKFDQNKSLCFIFTPEIYESETKILLDFSILCAEFFKDIKFIFKFHPGTNEKLFTSNKNYLKIHSLKNYNISNSDLNMTLKEATHIIYRGSASVIEACSYGVFPIYYDHKNSANINPLYEYYDDKLKVQTPQDLIKFTNTKIEYKYFDAFTDISEKYFSPININLISKILKK